ncbi:MAG: 50S ribosomal protein L1 [Bacilli bacterium]|nr:50S ribosomal protein L1 [Bacilli bacterium]
MKKRGKNFEKASSMIEKGKIYQIDEAIELLKNAKFAKFDETVTISFNLGIDTKQADQQLRGALVLPNGTGKTKTVLAITHKEDEAKAAGADFVGGKEMLEKIKNENWFGFDVIVATPDMMAELGKLGKLLGPKGLMPNPKTGTVSPDITKAVQDIKAGKVEYRADKEGNLHVVCGRLSFDSAKLAENIGVITKQIAKIKPASVKGVYIKNCVLSSTMGPGVKVNYDVK